MNRFLFSFTILFLLSGPGKPTAARAQSSANPIGPIDFFSLPAPAATSIPREISRLTVYTRTAIDSRGVRRTTVMGTLFRVFSPDSPQKPVASNTYQIVGSGYRGAFDIRLVDPGKRVIVAVGTLAPRDRNTFKMFLSRDFDSIPVFRKGTTFNYQLIRSHNQVTPALRWASVEEDFRVRWASSKREQIRQYEVQQLRQHGNQIIDRLASLRFDLMILLNQRTSAIAALRQIDVQISAKKKMVKELEDKAVKAKKPGNQATEAKRDEANQSSARLTQLRAAHAARLKDVQERVGARRAQVVSQRSLLTEVLERLSAKARSAQEKRLKPASSADVLARVKLAVGHAPYYQIGAGDDSSIQGRVPGGSFLLVTARRGARTYFTHTNAAGTTIVGALDNSDIDVLPVESAGQSDDPVAAVE